MKKNDVQSGLFDYFNRLSQVLSTLDTEKIAEMVRIMYDAYKHESSIFTMGNGGHANTAAHIINDFAKHTVSSDDKHDAVVGKRFRTMCLNDSVSFVTGIGNDMGFDYIFSEQLENWCDKGDVVIGISGSGNSENILKAFETAHDKGARTVCLSGKDGGKAKDLADLCIIVQTDKMVQIEDAHLAICHAVADELKKIVQNRTELKG